MIFNIENYQNLKNLENIFLNYNVMKPISSQSTKFSKNGINQACADFTGTGQKKNIVAHISPILK